MKLLHVASWMHYMLKGIPATRNKGFYVMMVPKLLEGFDVKYTQGTGQSRFTTNRSDVFHHEAGAKTLKRRTSSASSVTSELGKRSSDQSGGNNEKIIKIYFSDTNALGTSSSTILTDDNSFNSSFNSAFTSSFNSALNSSMNASMGANMNSSYNAYGMNNLRNDNLAVKDEPEEGFAPTIYNYASSAAGTVSAAEPEFSMDFLQPSKSFEHTLDLLASAGSFEFNSSFDQVPFTVSVLDKRSLLSSLTLTNTLNNSTVGYANSAQHPSNK
jgi:hypothetical protein